MKRVILWSSPRSLSTAFYRSMTTLTDTRNKYYFELFSYPYYFGPPGVRQSTRFDADSRMQSIAAGDMPCEPEYLSVMDLIQDEYTGIDLLFMKEMAFFIPEFLLKDIANMAGVHHTFLIRDPALSVSSYVRTNRSEVCNGEPDGVDLLKAETNYKQLCKLYRCVKECNMSDTPPIVVDANDLQASPNAILKRYCDCIGVNFESHMTSWEAGPVPDVSRAWARWLSTVEASTGIIQVIHASQKPAGLKELPLEVQEHIEECRQYYLEMFQERIRA